jgi:hypothetical protein
VGSPENAYHTFIENLRAILDVPVMDGVWLQPCEIFGEDLGKNLKCLGTRDPDDA